MMAGVILVIMGLTGMGAAVKYIPRPIVIGFTNGIAILIASTQVKIFRPDAGESSGVFWLRLESAGAEFSHLLARSHRAGRRHHRHHSYVPSAFEPHPRRDCRSGAGYAGGVDIQTSG